MNKLLPLLLAVVFSATAFADDKRIPQARGPLARAAMGGVIGGQVNRVERAPKVGFRYHFTTPTGSAGYRDADLTLRGERVFGSFDLVIMTHDHGKKLPKPVTWKMGSR